MLITDKDKLKEYCADRRVWQGIAGIARSKRGRTFVSFYSGRNGETFGNYSLILMSEGEREFEFDPLPVAVAYAGNRSRCFDPVLWTDPLSRLWFIWNVQPSGEVYASICEDPDASELSFGEAFFIGNGVMMNKPTVLSTGEWLFPIAVWRAPLHSAFRSVEARLGLQSMAYLYKSSDNGKSFVRLGGADLKDRSFDEHMVLELRNGVIMMLVRTTYGIGVTYSYDRGLSFSKGEDSRLGGPCSRFFISRLRSGRILLINHNNFSGRNNLTAFLSEDEGKSFAYSLLLDERSNISYPDAVEDENGFIYIVYDRERGIGEKPEDFYSHAREILLAKITEADILNGTPISKGTKLKQIVSKLGKLSSEVDMKAIFGENLSDRELAEELLSINGEDAISEVFDRFPINCENFTFADSEELDALIAEFNGSGKCDFGLLERIIALVRVPREKRSVSQPIVEAVIEYIKANVSEEITVSDIAAKVNVNKYYMAHIFKATTGTTVTDYRNTLRLTKAKRLLICSEMSIGEIAACCGFNTAAYFTELFTRSEKIPPTEYRRLHKLS